MRGIVCVVVVRHSIGGARIELRVVGECDAIPVEREGL